MSGDDWIQYTNSFGDIVTTRLYDYMPIGLNYSPIEHLIDFNYRLVPFEDFI
jgi:hypothetical protein